MPTGPLGGNLFVEIPISPPNPNSPPSANCVDALWTAIELFIPFKNIFSLTLIKSFFGIKLYEFLAGSKNLGKSSISKQIISDHFVLKDSYKTYLSFFDGSMDDESLGRELISLAKELNIEILEFNEVKNFDTQGNVDKYCFDKIILAVGPWSKMLLEQNNIKNIKVNVKKVVII